MDNITILEFALSLGLGLLVGFQREWTSPHVAGVRTFALITLFGTLCGKMAESTDTWVLAAGLASIVALLIHGTFLKFECEDEFGLTTHVAAALMFLVGAAIVMLPREIAVLLAGLTAVLLHWKEPIHSFIDRLGEKDLSAIIQVVLVALVILPVLPDKEYGPFGVLNPYQIWLVVVLVCGISVAGFIAAKFIRGRKGSILSGLLGGVISSSAATVSFSRQSQEENSRGDEALVIMLASTVVFLRVFFEVQILTPGVLWQIFPPLCALMAFMLALTIVLFFFTPGKSKTENEMEADPSQLKIALLFGGLYAIVLVAVAGVREYVGQEGLYVVAALSGLTDMNAITLSTARFIHKGQIPADMGWRMIMIGILANLFFKAGVVALLGSRALLTRIVLLFGITIAAGLGILIFWPGHS